MNNRLGGILAGWWAVVLIGFLTLAVVYQRWEMTHVVRRQFISVGEAVKPIQVEDSDYKMINVDWRSGGKGTLIYVLSPACEWRSRNMLAMKALLILQTNTEL